MWDNWDNWDNWDEWDNWDNWDMVSENHRPIRPTGLNRPICPRRQVKDIVREFYLKPLPGRCVGRAEWLGFQRWRHLEAGSNARVGPSPA